MNVHFSLKIHIAPNQLYFAYSLNIWKEYFVGMCCLTQKFIFEELAQYYTSKMKLLKQGSIIIIICIVMSDCFRKKNK